MSSGAPVPRSPPPRPQECAGAGPEAAAAPQVSWAQLSHIRPGPAGRSRARDAPRSCHEAGGWDPHSPGHSNGARGAVEPQGWGGPGAAAARRGRVSLSFPPRPGAGRKCIRQLLLLFLLQNAPPNPSSQTLREWGLMAGEAPRIAWTPSLAFPLENDRVCDSPEDSDWWASLETHLLAVAAIGGGELQRRLRRLPQDTG